MVKLWSPQTGFHERIKHRFATHARKTSFPNRKDNVNSTTTWRNSEDKEFLLWAVFSLVPDYIGGSVCSGYSTCPTTASCGLARGNEENVFRFVGGKLRGQRVLLPLPIGRRRQSPAVWTQLQADMRGMRRSLNATNEDVSTETTFVWSQAGQSFVSQTLGKCLAEFVRRPERGGYGHNLSCDLCLPSVIIVIKWVLWILQCYESINKIPDLLCSSISCQFCTFVLCRWYVHVSRRVSHITLVVL